MPMINCPDCSKEMSDTAPACPNCGRPNSQAAQKRPIGTLLGIGILLIPIIFSWFTLRKGHSTVAKVVSFLWLVLYFVIISASDKSNSVGTTTATATATSASSPAHTEVKEISEKVMQISIREILSDYKNNEVFADNKYKGNLVQVTGTIDDIKKDIMDNLYVTIGTGQQFEIPQVQAFFNDSMNNQLAQLSKGNRITVVCEINGLMMNVLAKRCVIK